MRITRQICVSFFLIIVKKLIMKLHKNSFFTLEAIIFRKQAECGDRGHPALMCTMTLGSHSKGEAKSINDGC